MALGLSSFFFFLPVPRQTFKISRDAFALWLPQYCRSGSRALSRDSGTVTLSCLNWGIMGTSAHASRKEQRPQQPSSSGVKLRVKLRRFPWSDTKQHLISRPLTLVSRLRIPTHYLRAPGRLSETRGS